LGVDVYRQWGFSKYDFETVGGNLKRLFCAVYFKANGSPTVFCYHPMFGIFKLVVPADTNPEHPGGTEVQFYGSAVSREGYLVARNTEIPVEISRALLGLQDVATEQ